jgi:hypothetical protein
MTFRTKVKTRAKSIADQAKKSSKSVNFITDIIIILPLITVVLTGIHETIQANPTATLSALALPILIKVSNIVYHFYKSIIETSNIVIPEEPSEEVPTEDNETYDLK